MARNIMIQGTMSGAGKSLLVTALCRIFGKTGIGLPPSRARTWR